MNSVCEQLWYDQPAPYWEAALPVGNGFLGAMVFGGTDEECLALNEGTLWSGRGKDIHVDPDWRTHVEHVRQLLAERRFTEADDFVTNRMPCGDNASYMPAGNLRLRFRRLGEPAGGYFRNLDFTKALAEVRQCHAPATDAAPQTFRRTFLASWPDRILACRITREGDAPFELEASFDSPMHGSAAVPEPGTLLFHGYAPFHCRYGQTIWQNEAGESGPVYTVAVRLVPQGTCTALPSETPGTTRLRVTGSVDLFIAIETDLSDAAMAAQDFALCHAAATARAQAAAQKGFDAILRDHLADYEPLYARSRLVLAARPGDEAPTDVRLAAAEAAGQSENVFSPTLGALLYNYGRYLLIACSRPGGQVANLQGLWNDSPTPIWGCNLTTNINTEMNYWHAELTGLPECAEPLFDFIEELSKPGADTARTLYGLPGWCTHHNSDVWRFTGPASGDACHKFWPVCAGWLCRHLAEHYRFGGDKTALRKHFDTMLGAAQFLSAFLVEKDGFCTTSPSTSPENSFVDPATGKRAAVAVGTQMDLSIIRDLFESLLECGAALGRDGEPWADTLRAQLARLAPPRIGADGRLLEFGEEFPEWEKTHRHLSHLYGVYPAAEFTPERQPECFEAARRSLDGRGDLSTGWAMGWRAALHVRFAQPARAMRTLGGQRCVSKYYYGYNFTTRVYEYLNNEEIFKIEPTIPTFRAHDLHFLLAEAETHLGHFEQAYWILNQGLSTRFPDKKMPTDDPAWDYRYDPWVSAPNGGYGNFGLAGTASGTIHELPLPTDDDWSSYTEDQLKEMYDWAIADENVKEYIAEGKSYSYMCKIAERYANSAYRSGSQEKARDSVAVRLAPKYAANGRAQKVESAIKTHGYFINWQLSEINGSHADEEASTTPGTVTNQPSTEE